MNGVLLRNQLGDGARGRTVTTLNVLRKAELCAAKCYQRVLRSLAAERLETSDLQECLDSHRRRAADLATEIFRRNGIPVTGPGLIDNLLCTMVAVLGFFGAKWLVRALESIEVHGIARYDKYWKTLDVEARDLVTARLVPQQVLSRQSVGLLSQSARAWDAART
jgi:hypothetical protein